MNEAEVDEIATVFAAYLRGRPLETTERVLATGGATEMARLAIVAVRNMDRRDRRVRG